MRKEKQRTPTYAIGSKEGPVMFDGTVYKSQKELTNVISWSFIITFIIGGFISVAYGIRWLAAVLWMIGALLLIAEVWSKK